METQKAIKLIKDYVKHYIFLNNLCSIGIRVDEWFFDTTRLCSIIFDIDVNSKNTDELLESFSQHADMLKGKIDNFHEGIPNEILTSTAIDIYSDWKAYHQKERVKL